MTQVTPPRRRDTAAARGGPADAGLIRGHLDHMAARGLSELTIAARRRDLTRMAAALPAGLAHATAADLAAWRAGLTGGVTHVVNLITSANQFYLWLMLRGIRPDNPAAGLARPKSPRRLPRPIGEDHLMAALAAAPPRIRPWLVLAGWAGLRAKEIALLRRENVMEQVTPPVLLIAADATKGRRERIVPMSPFVAAELAAAGLNRGWMFTRERGKPGPNSPHTVSRLCNQHLHDCGISATLHQLRHRFGTQAYRAIKDLRAVQELMGHADPAVTAGYAAYDTQAAVTAVNALPLPATEIAAAGPCRAGKPTRVPGS